jgi:hypothetical protein
MGFRQKARGKGEGEEKQVYLTSIGNAIIWVHLNLVEISRGRFGRTACAPTIGAIILL